MLLDYILSFTYRMPVVDFADFAQGKFDKDFDWIPGWKKGVESVEIEPHLVLISLAFSRDTFI